MNKNPVKNYYQEAGVKEWRRLASNPFHSLEFETTMRFLKKYLPKRGLVLDAGGGPGRYTIELAKLGYKLVLLDLTPKQLEIAQRQITKAKVENNVKEIIEGSIVDLSRFKNNTFDAVICLGGPVSHIKGVKNRQKAVSELFRVAKTSAPVFISVMGRLGVLLILPFYWPEEVEMTKHFQRIWQKGEDYLWCKNSYCHYFLPEEFEQLIHRQGAEILARVGPEGLAHAEEKICQLAKKHPLAWTNWLESHDKLCTHPAVFATSAHMLIIAGKK